MEMLNPYCGIDRDPRGVVRLTICNAGSLNILGSPATDGVRHGIGNAGDGPRYPRACDLPAKVKKA